MISLSNVHFSLNNSRVRRIYIYSFIQRHILYPFSIQNIVTMST